MSEEQNNNDQEDVSHSGSAIDKHKETVKGLVGAFKKSVKKTVGDLTQKKSSVSDSSIEPEPSKEKSSADKSSKDTSTETKPVSTSTAKPKPPVDYANLAKEKFFQAKKIAKEMVALALDKEIELDFTEAENANLISTTVYKENIALMQSHLDAYFSAKEKDEKQSLATARTLCRQDQSMLFTMIQDIKLELMLLYKAIENDEAMDGIKKQFDQVTEYKWRPIVDLKESDTDGAFCPSEDFNAKFIDLLSLNAAVNQSIHSKHDDPEKPSRT
tara:strand:- start:18351 stop:19166 length:816 start_codon:yes stop_codon:yes gene_type:complete